MMLCVGWERRNGPRARQGQSLSPAKRKKVIAEARRRGEGCYFMFLDICTGLDGVVEIHHVREVADTGKPDDSYDNLRPACKPCHTRWSARQSQKRAVQAANDWKRKPEIHPGLLP